MQAFDGKVALVGRATALCFARAGANVAVSDIDLAGCDETAQMVQALGRATVSVRVDVSIPASVQALVGEVVARLGRPDCAFNGAGVEGVLAPLADRCWSWTARKWPSRRVPHQSSHRPQRTCSESPEGQ